jgi:hypothetical protein
MYERCAGVSSLVEAVDCVERILKTEDGIVISPNALRVHAAKSGAELGMSGVSTPHLIPS